MARIVAFFSQLGRALLALLIQFSAPVLALYFLLRAPPSVGCLGGPDRTGSGCYGWSAGLGLVEIGQDATVMLPYALLAVRLLWPMALLCTFIALITTGRPRAQRARAGLLGLVAFVGTAYLTSSAGEDVSRIGLLIVAVVGGVAATYVLPRLITSSKPSPAPPGTRLIRSLLLVLAIIVVLLAGLMILAYLSAPFSPLLAFVPEARALQ